MVGRDDHGFAQGERALVATGNRVVLGRVAGSDPAVAPDGSLVVYASYRPDAQGGKPLQGGHLWKVDREDSRWSTPALLPNTVNFGAYVFAPSVAANHDLYFHGRDNPSHHFHLYRTVWRDGQYQKVMRLNLMQDGMHELDPAMPRGQSFIVFGAGRNGSSDPDHLCLAFREGAGWSTTVDLGNAVDAYQPWGAHLGPNGTALYFTGSHTMHPHWPRSHEQAKLDLAQTRAWQTSRLPAEPPARHRREPALHFSAPFGVAPGFARADPSGYQTLN